MADPIESQVNITGDAGPLKEELGQVRNIYEDINKDAEAFNTILSDTETRQQSILKGWNDVLAAIRDSESALRSLNTTEEAQQTSMRAFRQEIMEILQSVKGLGGNINNVMSIFQMAGGRGGGSFGSFQGAGYGGGYGSGDYSTASQDFRSTVESTTAGIDLSSTQQVQQARYANRTQSITPIGYDDDNDAGDLGGVFGGTYNSSRRPGERKPFGTESPPVPKKARQIRLQEQLDQYKNINRMNEQGFIFPNDREDIAASASLGYAMDTLNNTVGSIPGVGGPIVTAIRKSLNLSGVTNRNVRNAERNNTTRSVDPTTGETIFTRTGEYSDVEQKALKFADHIAGIFGNKMISSVMKYGGYAQMGVGLAEGIASNIRQVTGFAQNQGSVFGLTDFNRSASMTFGALVKSGFGLNPNYSFQQVMQNQMMGAALGLKGDQLNNYVNNALGMQTTYGLDATQSQQLLGGGLAMGVGMNANLQGIATIRNLANSTQTSTAYANAMYMSSMSQAAGMGVTGRGAVSVGTNAANFAAGDLIAQSAKLNATELSTTQFGTAMMAQALGVPYMQVYGKLQSMGGTSGSAFINASYQTDLKVLQMAGVNVASIKQKSDLNPYAQILQMICYQLGMTNITTPQKAVEWAWEVISNNAVGPTSNPVAKTPLNPNLPTPNGANLNKAAIELGFQISPTSYKNDPGALASIEPKITQRILNGLQTEQTDLVNGRYGKIGTPIYKKMLAEFTQAKKDYDSSDYAGAVKIAISFDKDAAKYLKAHHKNKQSGYTGINGTKYSS